MPGASLTATYSRSFLLRDTGNLTLRVWSTREAKPSHPDNRQTGIVHAKAYSANKELFAVMYSSYNIFALGFLPLLALNEGMI